MLLTIIWDTEFQRGLLVQTDFQNGKYEVLAKMLSIVQGVLLLERQTLRGDSRHEDKYYWIGNYGAQSSSVGARVH